LKNLKTKICNSDIVGLRKFSVIEGFKWIIESLNFYLENKLSAKNPEPDDVKRVRLLVSCICEACARSKSVVETITTLSSSLAALVQSMNYISWKRRTQVLELLTAAYLVSHNEETVSETVNMFVFDRDLMIELTQALDSGTDDTFKVCFRLCHVADNSRLHL
jgi:hypothetical protein